MYRVLTRIPLSRILINKKIAQAVIENGGDLRGKQLRSDGNKDIVPLFRIRESLERYKNEPNFKPIIVKPHESYPGLYTIMTGRHRVAASIINNRPDIRAVYYE